MLGKSVVFVYCDKSGNSAFVAYNNNCDLVAYGATLGISVFVAYAFRLEVNCVYVTYGLNSLLNA